MFIAGLSSSEARSYPEAAIFNVMSYGAVGDGVTDDSQAFTKAWEAVCEAKLNSPTLQVPQGNTFLLNPTEFSGPCTSFNIHVQIDGNLVAPKEPSKWEGKDIDSWLSFSKVDGFFVDGYGQIDGQGFEWWKSCPDNATLSNLYISAPETSPNTDGIDISRSKNVQILDTFVATGDDCVAINNGCSEINIIGMTCGPGHGISVGSLGEDGETAEVEQILVKNCTLNGTDNGVRIKTWQGGSGFARKITFQDIKLIAADNPIVIDQFYCPHDKCSNKTKAVQISDVSYFGIHGTSVKEYAIALDCSQTSGCSNILLDHIHITSTEANSKTYSSCTNAHGNFDDQEVFFIIYLAICIAGFRSSHARSYPGPATFNVMSYGAVGDGVTDDSQGFIKAWEAVCGAALNNPTFQVPQGKTFLLNPTKFSGPCTSSNIHVQIDGNLIAPKEPSTWEGKDINSWLSFSRVNGFFVDGNGQIDGQGFEWWKSCADNATLSNLYISAPATSPNTDGFDISNSKNIQILDTIVATGDDCVAINSGCSQINITGMKCGPGHGISVGSLGKNGETAEVEDILVKNCTFNGTQNGARIKTWQGGSGFARKITFQDITLIAADNPIVIDQYYCPHDYCSNQTKAVQISYVSYTGIHGTSIKEDAIALDCSQTSGCSNILLEHINITSTEANSNTYSSCTNAHGNYDDASPCCGLFAA
ncbi:Pectin lyase-like superfamily protein [Melia azedarach]|uniref:Pectin lyase-like superfamily protein n=1 Tax=Melia azedarach TaxID=155640 RepID=A0ACC1Y4K9_MELAZ|nr:Pectin lyase-like superfamily protein [Melia azedarach]